jgi:hypothetical protein
MEGVEYPSPYDIRTARHRTGLTMKEAAELVFVTRDVWLNWERNTDHSMHVDMHPAFSQLFALKVGFVKIEDICPHLKDLDAGT